jgi:hypothetical protein
MIRTLIYHRLWFMVVAVTLCLTGCTGKTLVESNLKIKGAPDWVNEGTQILKNDKGRLFHGVGSAPPMGSQSLQVSTADNRARAELARVLSSYMEVLSDDYLNAVRNSEGALSSGSVSQQIQAVSKINLTGAKIVGRWRDTKTAEVYSLAELDINQIKELVQHTSAMNDSLKEFLQTESDSIFDRQSGAN